MSRLNNFTDHSYRSFSRIVNLHLMLWVVALRGKYHCITIAREPLYRGFITVYKHNGNFTVFNDLLLAHDNVIAFVNPDSIHTVTFNT